MKRGHVSTFLKRWQEEGLSRQGKALSLSLLSPRNQAGRRRLVSRGAGPITDQMQLTGFTRWNTIKLAALDTQCCVLITCYRQTQFNSSNKSQQTQWSFKSKAQSRASQRKHTVSKHTNICLCPETSLFIRVLQWSIMSSRWTLMSQSS